MSISVPRTTVIDAISGAKRFESTVQKTNAFGTSLVLFLDPTSEVEHLQENLLHLTISPFLFGLIPARTELISAVIVWGFGYKARMLF